MAAINNKDNKNTKKIPDEFGKKIGGSKRDQWAARGLILSDLDGMNDAEKTKFIKKNNIWKTPDYKAMYESGRYDREVLYFIKTVKDKAATVPKAITSAGFDAASAYVEEMSIFRDKVMAITTWTECEDLLPWLMQTGRLFKSGYYGYDMTDAFRNIGGYDITRALSKMSLHRVQIDIAKKEFLYSDEDIFAKGYLAYPKASGEIRNNGSDGFMMPVAYGAIGINGINKRELEAIPAGTYVLIERRSRKFVAAVSKDYGDVKDMIHRLYEESKALRPTEKDEETDKDSGRKGKKRFKVPASVENCKRLKNGKDISLKKDVTPDDILTAFGFRGGEFGNWLNDETRQENLNHAYEAFTDLAIALGISASKIAFDGRLSIAFGARGRGSASAHYEPMREVINLTKFSGAGCLAHEFGHALDDILAKENGLSKPFSEAVGPKSSPAMAKLLSVMKYKKTDVKDSAEERVKKANMASKNLCRCFGQEFYRVNEEGKKAVNEWYKKNIIDAAAVNVGSRDNAWTYAENLLASLEALKRQVLPRTRKLKNEFRNAFKVYASAYFENKLFEAEVKKARKMTDYYTGSKKFDEVYQKDSHGYWSSDVELFARAFSCYIYDKLEKAGIEDDYLAGASNIFSLSIGDTTYRAYPYGEEREAINEAMEDFLNEVIGKASVDEAA